MTQRRSLCAHGVAPFHCSICSRPTDRGNVAVNADRTELRGRADPVRAGRRLLRVGGFNVVIAETKETLK